MLTNTAATSRSLRHGVTLPPGQRLVNGFPRFGTHLSAPAPAVPIDPVIEIGGAVAEPLALPLASLATLPRRELTADFHCVAGWSAINLHWEGVAFETFYRTIIEPSLQPDVSVTHVVFGGLDGYRAVALIEDALAEDVLIELHTAEPAGCQGRGRARRARRPDARAPRLCRTVARLGGCPPSR